MPKSTKVVAVGPIPVEDWGKDHWSLLAYIETCVVESDTPMHGMIDRDRIRCHSGKRAHLLGHRVSMCSPELLKWKPEHGSRLKGYFLPNGQRDTGRQIDDHDDWDCLEDMEKAGCIEIMSAVNAIVKLTDKGLELCKHLREHKARGGHFATFDFKPEMIAQYETQTA